MSQKLYRKHLKSNDKKGRNYLNRNRKETPNSGESYIFIAIGSPELKLLSDS